MRVLHVIPGLSDRSGGPAQMLVHLCRELDRGGVEPVVVTTDQGIDASDGVPLERPVRVAGVPVYCFRTPILQKSEANRPKPARAQQA
jgi:hypothetical protein